MLPRGNKTLPFKERMTGKSSNRDQVSARVPGSHPGDRWARGGQGRGGGHSGGAQESSATRVMGFLPRWSPGDRPASIVTGPGASPTPSLRPGPSPTLGTLGPHPPHDDTRLTTTLWAARTIATEDIPPCEHNPLQENARETGFLCRPGSHQVCKPSLPHGDSSRELGLGGIQAYASSLVLHQETH